MSSGGEGGEGRREKVRVEDMIEDIVSSA